MNKKFWASTFTLTGTIIGAGILGLPYVFAKSGFLIGVIWLIIIGLIMTFVNLCLAEITIRTRGKHQLAGYAKKYLGIWGERLMLTATFFGIYSALIAYLIGEGQSLSKLIAPDIPPILFGIIFWLTMTLLLREGLKGLKKVETWGVIAIITIVVGTFIYFLDTIKIQNLMTANPENFITPIGVVMFALLGFTSIPEIRKEIAGQEKHIKKAIIIGSLIPIVLYIIFSLTFIGVLGTSVSQVATLSFGPIMTLLGIFTMLTSYFVLSYSLSATFRLDLKIKKFKNFALVSLLPLTLYIIAELFQKTTFIFILGIGGVISAGITGILILFITIKSKPFTRNNKQPEINMPLSKTLAILLSIFFIICIILELTI